MKFDTKAWYLYPYISGYKHHEPYNYTGFKQQGGMTQYFVILTMGKELFI